MTFVFRGNSLMVGPEGQPYSPTPRVSLRYREPEADAFEDALADAASAADAGAWTDAILEDEDEPLPPGASLLALRDLLTRAAAGAADLAGVRRILRARHLLHFREDRPLCPRCGQAVDFLPEERALRCPACARLEFPRISPAVIVLVERGEEILLAHNERFRPGLYSLVAGFVEAGEGLEETVARELREEVGIEVEGIEYAASEPWPFPESLMVGFRARWSGGEIRVDGREILDAGWYGLDALPEIPAPGTLARRLIDGLAIDRARGRT